MKRTLNFAIVILLVAGSIALLHWYRRADVVPDDAKTAGKTPADFPETASRAFDAMDGGIRLSDDEVKGRNTWLLWTAGDQVFWDRMAQHGLGTADLLKTIDSRRRGSRFRDAGLVNEPGYGAAAQPDPYGLWLDTGPQEVDIDPVVYGRPTGVVGLRLYPNPHLMTRLARSGTRRATTTIRAITTILRWYDRTWWVCHAHFAMCHSIR